MKRILTPHARKILLLCSTFAALALVMFDTAKAENIVVTTTADNGPGSLRQAILDANASPEDDVITVAAQGTILLASPLPPISSSVTIIGPGTDLLAISGSYLYRVFEIESSTTVTLTNLTIKNGKAPVGEGGAGIKSTGNIHLFDLDIQGNFAIHDGAGVYLESGTAEISHSRVYSNISASGAGIHAADSIVQITDSEFASNGGSAISSYLTTLSMSNTAISANLGSGILSQDGVLNVDNSQITGNFDSGLLIDGSTFSIQNSFIADNHANRGGGIELPRGTGTITNTTIISNVAEVDGGGMRIDDLTAKVRIVDSQIAYNHASIGGGIHVGQAELVVQGTQIVSNTAGETGGAIYAESFPNTVVTDSCIVHNSDAAVTAYVDESAILAPNNWWGMDDGPGGTGPGFGDTVEGSVVYSDFKTTPPAGCPRLVPDLHISKVVRPDFALPGQVIAYTIVLSNAGTGADRNVSITDSLPAQIRFFLWREEPPPGTTVTDNSIAWSGSLAAQQNATFVFEIGNTGSYARSVTNTVSFIGSEQTGSASAGLALTTDPYFRHDARPKVAPSQFQYRTGEQVRVVISGVWPHRCVPEPTLQEYIHNPDPSVELPIHVYYSIDDGFRMELWMKELVKLRKEYEKAIAQGKGDEFYAKTCGDTETSWSYTFVGNDIPSALYDVVIMMDWEEWNPLNQYPQWYCYSPNHYYCYRSTQPNVFVVGELVNLPAIRK